jgi:hypothetical protein
MCVNMTNVRTVQFVGKRQLSGLERPSPVAASSRNSFKGVPELLRLGWVSCALASFHCDYAAASRRWRSIRDEILISRCLAYSDVV